MRHRLANQCFLHLTPHLSRHGVEVGVTNDGLELGEHFLRGSGFHSVHTDMAQESRLVLRTVDVQMPSIAISGFASSFDTREHTNAEQQRRDIVHQSPASRRVVDPSLAYLRVPPYGTIRRPKMAQEQRHLIRGQRENWLWYELFMAP